MCITGFCIGVIKLGHRHEIVSGSVTRNAWRHAGPRHTIFLLNYYNTGAGRPSSVTIQRLRLSHKNFIGHFGASVAINVLQIVTAENKCQY